MTQLKPTPTSILQITLLTALMLGSSLVEAQVPMSTDAGKRELQRQKEADQNYAAEIQETSNWDERAAVYFTYSLPGGEIEVSGDVDGLTFKAKKETITDFPATISPSLKQVGLSFTLQDGKNKRKNKVKCELPAQQGLHEFGVFLMPGTQRYNCLSRLKADDS